MNQKLFRGIINFGAVLLIVILINLIFKNLSGIQQFFIVLVATLLVNNLIETIMRKSTKV